jgi:hypothetical protein
MKKNTSLKLFVVLSKRVHKLQKARKLGWTWGESRKWTSQNIFKDFKGQFPSKVKVTDIDKAFISIVEPTKSPAPKIKHRIGNSCYDAFHLTDSDVEEIPYYFLQDVVFGGNGRIGFPDNLNVDVQIDGIMSTGIVPKGSLGTLQPVVEYLRRKYKELRSGEYANIIFKRLYVDPSINKKYTCNTYVLITEEGSFSDIKSPEDTIVITEKDLTPEERAKRKREKELLDAEERKKKSKRAVVTRPRPSLVEGKPEEEVKKLKPSATKEENLNEALKLLRKDYDDKILSKKEYLKRQEIILKKFESGGEI